MEGGGATTGGAAGGETGPPENPGGRNTLGISARQSDSDRRVEISAAAAMNGKISPGSTGLGSEQGHGGCAEESAGAAVRGESRGGSRGRGGAGPLVLGLASRRSAMLMLLVASTSALIPQACSSPSASAVAPLRAAVCTRGPKGRVMPTNDASARRLCSPLATVLGSAAVQDSVIRLRGGAGAKGATKQAAPNGVKAPSYRDKAVSADKVAATTDQSAAASAVEHKLNVGDEAVENADEGENKIVLQVDELKIEALRKLGASLRIGGRGTARRKFKAVRKKRSKMDDVKFQNALRKQGLNPVTDIEHVTVYKEDGTVWTFEKPRLLANQQANQFCIQGKYEERKPPPLSEAQIAAKAFDAMSDIDKLRQLAQNEMPAAAAGVATAADEVGVAANDEGLEAKGSPEDILAEEEKNGQGKQEDAVEEAVPEASHDAVV